MVGIENMKTVIGFGIDIAMNTVTAMEDGKFQVKDGLLYIGVLPKIPAVIKAAPQVHVEYLDMDDQEREELFAFVIAKVKCGKDEVKRVIDSAFRVAIDASIIANDLKGLIDAIKDLKKAA